MLMQILSTTVCKRKTRSVVLAYMIRKIFLSIQSSTCSVTFLITRCHAKYHLLSEGGALLSTFAGGNGCINVTLTQYFCLWAY